MDEIEVIRTIEELRKFLNDKNFMEIVVRQKNKRFKKFYKVALDNIFKEAEQQMAAKEVLKAVQKNSKLLNQNLKMVKMVLYKKEIIKEVIVKKLLLVNL